MQPVEVTRREKLAILIREAGSQSELSEKIEKAPAQISQWLNASTNSKTGKPRVMSNAIAREIELKLEKPFGWMDQPLGTGESALGASRAPVSATEAGSSTPPDGYIRLEHLSPSPSMGGGAYLDEPVHVVRHLDVLEQWVRQKVGTTDPGRIKVLTGNGQSMAPTIQDQDLVFVDIAQRTIEGEGIYVIDVAGLLLLKKALILSDGTLILRSDNTADYPNEERHDLRKVADTICIAGRVLAWWTLRRG